MKYGRHIRKTSRYFKKASRRFRKARRIAAKRRFERRLNSVAEKKLNNVTIANSKAIDAAASNTVLSNALLDLLYPAYGDANYNRIGTKIFIRYITVQITIYNVDTTHACYGMVGLLTAIEKKPGTGTATLQDLLTGGLPNIQASYLKSQYSKLKLKTWNMCAQAGWSAGGVYTGFYPTQVRMKKRFKIMKNCTITTDNKFSLPEIWVVPVYFAAPLSHILTNPGEYSMEAAMTFTDV